MSRDTLTEIWTDLLLAEQALDPERDKVAVARLRKARQAIHEELALFKTKQNPAVGG